MENIQDVCQFNKVSGSPANFKTVAVFVGFPATFSTIFYSKKGYCHIN